MFIVGVILSLKLVTSYPSFGKYWIMASVNSNIAVYLRVQPASEPAFFEPTGIESEVKWEICVSVQILRLKESLHRLFLQTNVGTIETNSVVQDMRH